MRSANGKDWKEEIIMLAEYNDESIGVQKIFGVESFFSPQWFDLGPTAG